MNDKPINLKLIKGVGNKVFYDIKNKIIKNYCLAELMNEYREFNMSLSMLKKLYDLYPSVEMIKEKMIKDPYECLCKIGGVAFKKADGFILKKYPQLKDSDVRAKSFLVYLLNQNEKDGNTWITLPNLCRKASEIDSMLSRRLANLIAEDENIYYDHDTNRVSRRITYNIEHKVYEMLRNLNNSHTLWTIDTSKYKFVGDFPMTDEQCSIQDGICQNDLCILTGGAGTGKTASTKALVAMLKDNKKSFALFAPTGKASRVLAENTGEMASTIHRGLGFNPRQGFVFNKDNPLKYDVIIVDEFSMIDINLMFHLLRAIKPGTKLIFIGDYNQISSVDCGNVAYDMLESKVFNVYNLSKVFRYSGGGLAYVNVEINNGNFYLDTKKNVQVLGDDKDYVFINCPKTAYLDVLKKMYLKKVQASSVDDVTILTYTNSGELGCININRVIQDIINPKSPHKKEISIKVFDETITFREHDRVMLTKNNYEVQPNIYNGDTGTIIKIEDKYVTIDFYGDLIDFKISDMQQFLLAYCITLHKSQGSSVNHVIIINPPAHKFLLNKNIMYVGTSRARTDVTHISDFSVIKSAIRKSENKMRNTWLQDFLKGIA